MLETYWNLVLNTGRFWMDGNIRFKVQGSAPATPPANNYEFYAKSTGLFIKNSSGTEIGPLSTGVSDHGGLTGLSDDDHSIYALLAGRATGQTLKGGTASGDDLTLMSTNHGTKGHLLFGTSGYDEVNNRLGIGHTVPAFGVHASGASPGCHVAGTRLSADALGPAFIGQKARGTPGSPTVVLANDQLLQLVGQGYENGSYHTQANIKIFAAENWSGSAKGTYITFETAAAGGTSITEKLRLLSDGKLGLGITNPTYQMEVSNDAPLALALRNAGSGGAYAFHFLRSRNTLASPQATAASDSLGSLNWGGYQGASWAEARARIIGFAGSLWSGSNQETYITVHTTASGATTPSERFRIGSAGQLGIGGATYGSDGSYFRSAGASAPPVWSTLILPNAATANRIVYASSSNTYGESANLAFDGTDFLLGSGIRARMASQNRFRYLNTIAKVKRGSNQSINDTTVTVISFDTEDNDTDTLHDNSTNPSRITVRLAGKYIVGGLMRYAVNGTGDNRQARVHKNGSLVDGAFAEHTAPSATQETHVFVVSMIEAAANDYFEFAAFQDSGGALNVESSQTRFWAAYIGE